MEKSINRVYQRFPKWRKEIKQLARQDPDFRELCEDYQDVAILLESLEAEIAEKLQSELG